jgi:hypothetical protein
VEAQAIWRRLRVVSPLQYYRMSQLNLRDPCPQSTSLGPGDLGRSARPSPFASPEVLGTCVYRVPQLRGTGILDLLLPRAIGRDRQTMLGLVRYHARRPTHDHFSTPVG